MRFRKSFEPSAVNFTSIAKGEIYPFSSNYPPETTNLVFETQSDWDDYLATGWGGGGDTPDEFYNIDFENEMAIVCLDQVRAGASYDFEISDITEYEFETVITIDQTDNGGIPALPTRPFQIIKLPKTEKELVFEYE